MFVAVVRHSLGITEWLSRASKVSLCASEVRREELVVVGNSQGTSKVLIRHV